jgi:hypothetical protein
MSYPPPSTPGQPSPYGQQPQYGQPGYYPPPPQQRPDGDERKRRSRKKKYTAAGVLGVAASIATILTLFITLDQQPQPNNGPNTGGGSATTPANVYPVNVQTNFLNSCEANGSPQVCECSLSWFEQHVTLSQFEQDETELEQGGQPADIVSVEQTCG